MSDHDNTLRVEVPSGSVVVTPEAQYRQLQDLQKSVDRLTSVVDPALNEIRRDVAESKAEGKEKFADHEARLRGLERFRWQALGMALLAGPAAGVIADLLMR